MFACHCLNFTGTLPHKCTPQEDCYKALTALLAWTNSTSGAAALRTPQAAAALLHGLRGALAAASKWGSASVTRHAAQLMLKVLKALASPLTASTVADAKGRTKGPRGLQPAADGDDSSSKDGWAALSKELPDTTDTLLALAVSLPTLPAGAPAVAPPPSADPTSLYLQAHAIACTALLAAQRCAAMPSSGDDTQAQLLRECVSRAVRAPPSGSKQAAAQAAAGTPQRQQRPAEADGQEGVAWQQQGWLLCPLQKLMAACCPPSSKGSKGSCHGASTTGATADSSDHMHTPAPHLSAATPPLTSRGKIDGGVSGCGARGTTPFGAPGAACRQQLRLSTPPPSPSLLQGVSAAEAPKGGGGAAAPATPQHAGQGRDVRSGSGGGRGASTPGGAPAVPATAGAPVSPEGARCWQQQLLRRHAAELALSGVRTWGAVVQLLGGGMLEDKTVAQPLLNVSRVYLLFCFSRLRVVDLLIWTLYALEGPPLHLKKHQFSEFTCRSHLPLQNPPITHPKYDRPTSCS